VLHKRRGLKRNEHLRAITNETLEPRSTLARCRTDNPRQFVTAETFMSSVTDLTK